MEALVGESVTRLVHAALLLLVAGAASFFARRQPEHRVVAVLFAVYVIANVAHLWLDRRLAPVDPPYRGALLLAYYADHASTLLPPTALAGAVYVHFARRPPLHVVAAFAALLGIVVAYKETTGASLVAVHEVVWLVASLVSWVIIARAVLGPTSPDAAHSALMLLAAGDAVRTAFSLGAIELAWVELRDVDIAICALLSVGYGCAWARAVRHANAEVEP